MEWISKHFGLLKNIGNFRFKRWLNRNAFDFLSEVGAKEEQKILDFGYGSDKYTLPATELVGNKGTVYAADVDEKALDELEEKADSQEIGNIVRIDIPNKGEIILEGIKLDLVLLIDVLQEIEDRSHLFEKISETIKPDEVVCVYPMHLEEKKLKNWQFQRVSS